MSEVRVRGFGELESVIMDRVWSAGAAVSVREILDDLRREREIAYTTVMTVMDNLYRKGWLVRDRDGRAYRYRAVSTREEYTARLMSDALAGSRDTDAAMMHFLDRLSEEEAGALRRALQRARRRRGQ